MKYNEYYKSFKKTIFSNVFSVINLLGSCTQYDDITQKTLEPLNLSSFIKKQLKLSSEIITLLKNEKGINLEILENTQNIKSFEQVEEILARANIKKAKEISKLMSQMDLNNKSFTKNNIELKKISGVEIENIITDEIDKQLSQSYFLKVGSCSETYRISQDRCGRDFAISTVVSGVVGALTAGWGFAAGMVAASISFTTCLMDADADYNRCRESEN